jgi:hypothetical protein
MLQDVGQAYVHLVAPKSAFYSRARFCYSRAEATRFIAGPRHQKVAPPPLAKRFLQICKFRTLSLSLLRRNGERGGH